MDVLESSITDLTPNEVSVRLQAGQMPLDQSLVEARLDKLREWGAASARTDTSRILRHRLVRFKMVTEPEKLCANVFPIDMSTSA